MHGSTAIYRVIGQAEPSVASCPTLKISGLPQIQPTPKPRGEFPVYFKRLSKN